MKTIRIVFIVVLIFVVVVTGYYAFRRYIINDNLKGISPTDLVNIGMFLILPLTVGIFLTKRLGKRKSRRK